MTNVLSNSNSSKLIIYMSNAREASKLVGDSAAGSERGLTALTANTVLAYQADDYIRDKINDYLASRNAKMTSKQAKDAADTWFEREFEIAKPTKSAMQISKFKYQNRLRAHIRAFTRAKDYTSRGISFYMDKDNKRIFVTKESYAKVSNDVVTADVEVVAKTSASSDKITFNNLEVKREGATKAAKATVQVTGTPANVTLLCKAVTQASEAIDADKLDGATRSAMFDALFALQIALSLKQDKAALAAYEEIKKAQAA